MTARTSWCSLWKPSLQKGTERLKYQTQRWIPLQTCSLFFKVGLCLSVQWFHTADSRITSCLFCAKCYMSTPSWMCFIVSLSLATLHLSILCFILQYTFSHNCCSVLSFSCCSVDKLCLKYELLCGVAVVVYIVNFIVF